MLSLPSTDSKLEPYHFHDFNGNFGKSSPFVLGKKFGTAGRPLVQVKRRTASMKEPVENRVFKGVTDIHGRLFDHKPVIQAEIKYFVKEFETKRNGEEYKRLEKSLADIKEMKTERLPEVTQLMESQLPEILIQMSAATNLCEKLIAAEEKHLQSNVLEERRKQRAVRWTDFREKLAQERDQVDTEHVQRTKAVEDHFERHTEKLASIGDT